MFRYAPIKYVEPAV